MASGWISPLLAARPTFPRARSQNMSATPIHPSIERNNLAISFMERKDFVSAITSMNESIWILKQEGADHDLLPLVPSLRASSDESTPPPLHKENHRNHRQDIFLDDAISIFQCPLRIHPDTVIGDDTCAEICAILAYNCALAHHLNGVELDSDEERYDMMKQALSLYQTAHGIHSRQENVEDSDASFTLAVLNNVGHIQGLMGNAAASTRLFNRMLRILMVVVSQTEECTASTDLFFSNCSRCVLETPAAPAA